MMPLLQEMQSRLTIDLSAIRANVAAFPSRVMAMVKAEGYGTNGVTLTRFLEGCGVSIFGLAYVSEALALRRAGITSELFVLYAAPHEAEIIATHDLQVAVCDTELVDALAATGRPVRVHIHLDTGMKRFGCQDADALATYIATKSNLDLIGIMSHLVAAENPMHDAFTLKQIEQFLAAARPLDLPWRHLMATDGAARFPLPEANMVRIGLGLFGCHNSSVAKEALPLTPALSLRSHIVAVHEASSGDTVGYGRRYTITKPSCIGVIPLGYYDGIPRTAKHLIVNGAPVPIAGSVCMDFCMVDAPVEIGDSVELFGDARSAEDAASDAQINACSLLTGIGSRVPRVFLDRG